mgnify:CR=1 FL=1
MVRNVNNFEYLYLHSLQELRISKWFAIIGLILIITTHIATKFNDHKFLEFMYKTCSWFIIVTIVLLPIAIIGLIIFFAYVGIFCKQ